MFFFWRDYTSTFVQLGGYSKSIWSPKFDLKGPIFFFFFFFFFNSVLLPFQDYFSSYETGQSVGGAKMGGPREKPPDTPASRTWLVSHVDGSKFTNITDYVSAY